MKTRLVLLTLVVAAAVTGITCQDAEEEEKLTPAESAYLDSVEQAWALFGAKVEESSALFGQVWPLASMLFQSLEQAGAGTAIDDTLAALEKLVPPERFEADHDILLTWTREMVSLDREVGQKIADENVVGLALANVALNQASTRGALRLSSPLCEAASLIKEGPDPLCERLAPGQGGPYGAELYKLMSDLETEFRSRTQILVPPFATEALFKVLTLVKPEVVRAFEQAAASVGALEPPANFKQDHALLLAYLDEELQAAQAIGLGPPEMATLPPGISP